MEKIARHIETLLRRHDFVIVPDFGGFVTQFQSTKIIEEQIHPPLAVVGFNPLMSSSDGLLAIEISRAEDKSFREAVQLIESEVNSIKQLLSQKKNVACGRLGTLSSNNEGKTIFLPAKNNTFLPANYGLNTLYYSRIAQQTETQTQKKVTISIPSRTKVARYAAVAIIALGLTFTAPKLNDARNATANFNPISFINTSQKTILEENTVPAEKTEVINTSQTEKKIVTAEEEKKFHVIVGCLATQKKADDLIAYLKSNNYPNASIILPRIVTYRIAIDSFATQEEAVSFMRNLREVKPEFSDAWVLNY